MDFMMFKKGRENTAGIYDCGGSADRQGPATVPIRWPLFKQKIGQK
jgi:hypothetical protein